MHTQLNNPERRPDAEGHESKEHAERAIPHTAEGLNCRFRQEDDKTYNYNRHSGLREHPINKNAERTNEVKPDSAEADAGMGKDASAQDFGTFYRKRMVIGGAAWAACTIGAIASAATGNLPLAFGFIFAAGLGFGFGGYNARRYKETKKD